MKLTDEQIEEAKRRTKYTHHPVHHEHPDCIRIAVEWLSAQRRTMQPTSSSHNIKRFVETWAGRYVSQHDCEVAATLLGLQGRYPRYNIHGRLTRPRLSRLAGIGQAFTQKNYLERPWTADPYTYSEADDHSPCERPIRIITAPVMTIYNGGLFRTRPLGQNFFPRGTAMQNTYQIYQPHQQSTTKSRISALLQSDPEAALAGIKAAGFVRKSDVVNLQAKIEAAVQVRTQELRAGIIKLYTVGQEAGTDPATSCAIVREFLQNEFSFDQAMAAIRSEGKQGFFGQRSF